jgi:hypothetical protein
VVVVVHTLHIIWIYCNSLRFYMDTVSVHAAKVCLHALVSLSGNHSVGHFLLSDVPLLDSFSIVVRHRRIKDIFSVHWKAPSPPWLKVNTDGSVVGNHAACGSLFHDHLGTFLGAFACNLGDATVFSFEIQGFMFAPKFAAKNGWRHVWLESDFTSALMAFEQLSVVPILLRNHWHNACSLGVQVVSSYIYRQGNCC